jgi:hypothetical protein
VGAGAFICGCPAVRVQGGIEYGERFRMIWNYPLRKDGHVFLRSTNVYELSYNFDTATGWFVG